MEALPCSYRVTEKNCSRSARKQFNKKNVLENYSAFFQGGEGDELVKLIFLAKNYSRIILLSV